MTERAMMKGAAIWGHGDYPAVSTGGSATGDTSINRQRNLTYLLGRLESLLSQSAELAMSEIDIFLRGQPVAERDIALEELTRAAATFPSLLSLVQDYARRSQANE